MCKLKENTCFLFIYLFEIWNLLLYQWHIWRRFLWLPNIHAVGLRKITKLSHHCGSVLLGPTTISKHNVHDLNVNHLTHRRESYNCVGEDSGATPDDVKLSTAESQGKRQTLTAYKTMSVLHIVGLKCKPAASHAAPWWVTVNMHRALYGKR